MRKIIFCLCVFVALPISVTAETKSAAPDIRPMMHQNFQTILKLQEYAVDPNKLTSPANYEQVRKLIDQLAGVSHVLPSTIGKDRPGLVAIAVVFEDYLKDLKNNLGHAHPVYLSNKIMTATSFCFECHTGLSTNKSFQDVEKRIENSRANPLQKAQFYAATRQFDKAIPAYERLLNESTDGDVEVSDLGRALRGALSLAIRVKRDPDLAMKFLKEVEARKGMPEFFLDQVDQWEKDVGDWKKEKDLKSTASGDQYLKKADDLIQRAEELQSFPADRAGDISYLRAINDIHEALFRDLAEEKRAEAFYLLGKAYAVLEDPLLWTLDDYYFDACIQSAPHTKQARQCFDRYSQEVYFGFTGSVGTDIPKDEREKLLKLQKMAQ